MTVKERADKRFPSALKKKASNAVCMAHAAYQEGFRQCAAEVYTRIANAWETNPRDLMNTVMETMRRYAYDDEQ